MEFAHDFTFRGLRLVLREGDFMFSSLSTASVSSCIGDGSGDGSEVDSAGSEALKGNVGTLGSLRRISRRKKPRRLARRRGELEAAALVGEAGDTADMGRLRLNSSL